jgi:hypothetical protein
MMSGTDEKTRPKPRAATGYRRGSPPHRSSLPGTNRNRVASTHGRPNAAEREHQP